MDDCLLNICRFLQVSNEIGNLYCRLSLKVNISITPIINTLCMSVYKQILEDIVVLDHADIINL